MQDSTFIGLDVRKATISIAVDQGEPGGKFRHLRTVGHRDHGVYGQCKFEHISILT